jgi:hypothetical protein
MRPPATIKWVGLALVGLLIAIGVAIASTNLVSQQIGISSESISAGDALAPVVGTARGHRTSPEQRHGTARPAGREGTTTAPTTTGEPPAVVPTEPAEEVPGEPESSEPRDDHGGSHGGGGGNGPDD